MRPIEPLYSGGVELSCMTLALGQPSCTQKEQIRSAPGKWSETRREDSPDPSPVLGMKNLVSSVGAFSVHPWQVEKGIGTPRRRKTLLLDQPSSLLCPSFPVSFAGAASSQSSAPRPDEEAEAATCKCMAAAAAAAAVPSDTLLL